MWTKKDELRRKMKSLRAEISDKEERNKKIFQNLFFCKEFLRGERYFIYRSFGSEADTAGIVDELLRRGKKVYFPRTRGSMMEIVRFKGQAFRRGAYGIEEPEGEASEDKPDICILPLLAADKECRRLGYGGGYYDRFLSGKGQATLKIGICYQLQIIDEIPVESHDVPADIVITDENIFYRRIMEDGNDE